MFGTWIHGAAGPVCMCVHATVRACLLVCLRYRQQTWRATRADGVPKFQRLADIDRSRREVRREGLAGLEGRESAPVIHAMRRVCLCWTRSVRAPERGVHGREVSVAGSLRSPALLFVRRGPSAESPILLLFAPLSESPVNSGVCRRDRLAIKSSQSPFSYLG